MHRSTPISTVILIPFHCSLAVGNITLTAYNYVIIIVSPYASPLNATEATLACCNPPHASPNLYLSILPLVFKDHRALCAAFSRAASFAIETALWMFLLIREINSVARAFETHPAIGERSEVTGQTTAGRESLEDRTASIQPRTQLPASR